jgi:hypothetical protein
MRTIRLLTGILSSAALLVFGSLAHALPILDGSIGGGEGWTLFTEVPDARPFLGGSPTQSDDFLETSQYHWWDGSTDRGFSTGPRGGVNNVYWTWDSDYLYLGVRAGTAPFNAWVDSGGNNDQGNLYIAIDTNPASGSQLTANQGHSSYGGVKAVDFDGWQPKYVVGVLYYDNGGGGGGAANVEQTITHNVTGGNTQGTAGNLEWTAGNVSGGLADYELRIKWSLLGFPSVPLGQEMKLAMYMTQNGERWDAYDSGPGIGNNGPYEQIGDNPGDRDDNNNWSATDFLGVNVPNSSYPGSNEVFSGSQYGGAVNNNFDVVGHGDEIDTIQEYFVFVIPEPSTLSLATFALAGLVGVRLLRKKFAK